MNVNHLAEAYRQARDEVAPHPCAGKCVGFDGAQESNDPANELAEAAGTDDCDLICTNIYHLDAEVHGATTGPIFA